MWDWKTRCTPSIHPSIRGGREHPSPACISTYVVVARLAGAVQKVLVGKVIDTEGAFVITVSTVLHGYSKV